jgi:uncharacterized protein
VGCRRRAPSNELTRIVFDSEGHLALDPARRAPGRGAYVCSDSRKKCFELAAARGRLGRALRGPVDAAQLEAIAEVLEAEASGEKQELIG